MKKIFVINGSGGVGKDAFVHLVSLEVNDRLRRFRTVWNYSSVDKVKQIAKQIGWNGSKTEKDRKFLSELKMLTTKYYDMAFNDMKLKVEEFQHDEGSVFLFLHIREPQEIERAVKEFGAKTILIVRDNVDPITSNEADKNVFSYKYDMMIVNNGSLDDLDEYAKCFVKKEMEGCGFV